MFLSSLFVLLLIAQCLTDVVSLKIPSPSPGKISATASNVRQAPPILNTTGSSANNRNALSCPGCSVGRRDEEDKTRIELAKRKILYQLQMTEPPKRRMRGKRLPSLPSTLKQMNLIDTSQQNTEPDDEDDNTVSKPLQFIVVGQRVRVQKIRRKSLWLGFPFNSKIYKNSIASAKLWVHIKHKRNNGKTRKLVVKDLANSSQPTGRELKPTEKGWISIDVTHMVKKWIRKDIKSHRGSTKTYSHTIQIDCANCDTAKKVIHYSSDKHKPLLNIDLDTTKTRRRKKRSAECVAGMKKCCLRRLYLNFTSHGWDKWIVAPLGFHVNYCTGACLGHGLPRFHHSSAVQSVVTNQTITQCCSPSRLTGVSMLYYDDKDIIIKKDLSNLKVEGCKCA